MSMRSNRPIKGHNTAQEGTWCHSPHWLHCVQKRRTQGQQACVLGAHQSSTLSKFQSEKVLSCDRLVTSAATKHECLSGKYAIPELAAMYLRNSVEACLLKESVLMPRLSWLAKPSCHLMGRSPIANSKVARPSASQSRVTAGL
jgi:hypothetical protein